MFCAIPDTVYMAIVLQEKGYSSLEIADAGIAVLEGFLSNSVTYELTVFIGLGNIAWWFVSLAMYRVETDNS